MLVRYMVYLILLFFCCEIWWWGFFACYWVYISQSLLTLAGKSGKQAGGNIVCVYHRCERCCCCFFVFVFISSWVSPPVMVKLKNCVSFLWKRTTHNIKCCYTEKFLNWISQQEIMDCFLLLNFRFRFRNLFIFYTSKIRMLRIETFTSSSCASPMNSYSNYCDCGP